MQMSQAALFIFVESPEDRYVYSQIADPECQGRGIDYQVVTSEELQQNEGGKQVLLGFFDYLRRQSSLTDRFKGKTTVSIFFLDKDVDDFLRITTRRIPPETPGCFRRPMVKTPGFQPGKGSSILPGSTIHFPSQPTLPNHVRRPSSNTTSTTFRGTRAEAFPVVKVSLANACEQKGDRPPAPEALLVMHLFSNQANRVRFPAGAPFGDAPAW